MTANEFKIYNLGAVNILGRILDIVEKDDKIDYLHTLLDVIEGLKIELEKLTDLNYDPQNALIEHLKEKLKQEKEELNL